MDIMVDKNQPAFVPGSVIPDKHFAAGEGLGLACVDQQYSSKNHHFVAVEFDIFTNYYDPRGDHFNGTPNGTRTDAWITYNSISKNLSVVFTGFKPQGNTIVTILQNLSYILDMKEYLPEWVTVGFSGEIGTFSAIHTIYSWNFTSSFNYNGNITDPDIPIPRPMPNLYVPLQSLVLNPNVPLPRPMLNPDIPLPSHVPEDTSKQK
ncbi:agglutinin-2-like [Solanum pennellii]|uniref:Agglutinin-2-like n=1 Tax=Solanum pennellii TaxID=28526 RepID=A0ABM1UWQ5_SOLPN|nr:agglutinin-2-like [Solanum pennellii]